MTKTGEKKKKKTYFLVTFLLPFSLLSGRPPKVAFSLPFRYFGFFGVSGSVGPFAPHNLRPKSCILRAVPFLSPIVWRQFRRITGRESGTSPEFLGIPCPKDPLVPKSVERVNSLHRTGSNIAMAIVKHYRERLEMLVFLGKGGGKAVQIVKNCGGGTMVRSRAPCFF